MLPLRLERPLVVVDVETTSNEPENARIVEIALERYMPDGSMTAYCTLINPEVTIPSGATDVHGITTEMVQASPTWAVAGPRIMRAFKGEWGVADIAGYNVRFDCQVIANENRRCKVEDEGAGAVILDGFRLWQFLEPRALSDAVKRWAGRDHTGAHRAEADVRATRDVLFTQLAGDERFRGKTVAEVDAIVNPPDPKAATSDGKLRFIENGLALNFGKFRGLSLKEADTGLLKWVLRQDFAKDTKALVESELKGRRR